MPTTLIVLAHPERRSFNGSWAEASAAGANAAGHDVLWSDLCSTDFDPVESPAHYPEWKSERPFDPLKAQEDLTISQSNDVTEEIQKINQADYIIFHFPIWWFAPPAVLKGWFDRVLMHGVLHSVDARFDKGKLWGKRALFCVSTGASENECAFNGKEGDIFMQLWPTAQTLRYLGMTILEPKIEFGVHGYFEGDEKRALEDRLKATLSAQAKVVSEIPHRPEWTFNVDADFDADGRLKPDAQSHSPFIRHRSVFS